MSQEMTLKKKWWALLVLCLGTLMIVLDSTIVNVALPSIQKDLGFDPVSLAWVVNGYMLTFGGFLLLGGKLGDLYGHRKFFLIGITVFTFASLACGLSNSEGLLIAARAIQGLGGALVSAVGLSIMVDLFTEPNERAKAMGIFGFVAAGGGSVGVLLGGVLTGTLNWHYIFLVNIPVGVAVGFLSFWFLPKAHKVVANRSLDIWGAITVTSALMLAVYAIVNGNSAGWISMQTLGLFFTSAILITVFLFIESRVKAPLIPLGIFKIRNIAVANITGVFWAAAMFAWFFLSALYMQLVLGYSPLTIGLTFLPSNIIMAVFSIWLSAKIVMKYGIKKPLAVGLFIAGIGLLLLAQAPVNGNLWRDIIPSMIILGFGAGMAFNPMLLAAMNDVDQNESGLASGLVNTSFMMGGALGLAILASLAAAQTNSLLAQGVSQLDALMSGYHVAFYVGALFAIGASLVSGFGLSIGKPNIHKHLPEVV